MFASAQAACVSPSTCSPRSKHSRAVDFQCCFTCLSTPLPLCAQEFLAATIHKSRLEQEARLKAAFECFDLGKRRAFWAPERGGDGGGHSCGHTSICLDPVKPSGPREGGGARWQAFLRAYLRGRCVCLDPVKHSGPRKEGMRGGISRTHAHYVCLDPFKPSGPRKAGRGGGISRTHAPARTLVAYTLSSLVGMGGAFAEVMPQGAPSFA